MVAVASMPIAERAVAFPRVPWKTYVLLRDAIDAPQLKMTYCEGVLELTSPSEAHELNKSHLARLVELYAFLTGIRVGCYGSTTFKSEARERGVEPDECWRVEREPTRGQLPHIVLEVIETAPLLDKLHVYDGLEVPEVWLLEQGKLFIHRRKARGGYVKARRSAFLPDLDPKLLERFLPVADEVEAQKDFATRVRGGRKKPRRRKS
ncbi:MAG TPA: Uma2 family endonuclease [Polyangiaceae bacterium]